MILKVVVSFFSALFSFDDDDDAKNKKKTHEMRHITAAGTQNEKFVLTKVEILRSLDFNVLLLLLVVRYRHHRHP